MCQCRARFSPLGDGLTRFSAGHNIILSIFTNNLEVDTRLSALEQKTINMSLNSTSSTFTKNFNLNIAQTEQFNINDVAGTVNYFQVSNDSATLSRDLNMDGKPITNVAYPINGTDVSSKAYVDNLLESYTPLADFNDLSSVVATNSNDIDVLQGQTQNLSATTDTNTFNRSLNILLDPSDYFAIRSGDQLNNYLILTPLETQIYKKINMNSSAIENVSGIRISGYSNSDYFVKSNGGVDSTGILQRYENTETCCF